MANVLVDTEKLAYGLKRGIAETDTIYSAGPEEYMLRYTACGLVSSAIYQYCKREGIPSGFRISSPNLPFDSSMHHVVPIVGESGGDATVVDASYSQFLGYVGLHWGYETTSGAKAFPEEEIIDFRISETENMVDWLTSVAVQFQERNRRPCTEYGYDQGRGPLVIAERRVIKGVFNQIWNPANLKAWEPPERVLRDGQIVASRIDPGAITITA